MRTIRQPGYALLTRPEWEAVLPFLLKLGYRWDQASGGGRLWGPEGRRCVGEYRQDEGQGPAWLVEAAYLVDVLPLLLGE